MSWFESFYRCGSIHTSFLWVSLHRWSVYSMDKLISSASSVVPSFFLAISFLVVFKLLLCTQWTQESSHKCQNARFIAITKALQCPILLTTTTTIAITQRKKSHTKLYGEAQKKYIKYIRTELKTLNLIGICRWTHLVFFLEQESVWRFYN